jgi:hypothetical protein
VGKKFMLLDACSILKVYRGVLDKRGLAVTAVMARSVMAAPATIKRAFFLSMNITYILFCN